MEAQDPVNKQLDSEASDSAPFESVNEPDERLESDGPADGQLDLQDQQSGSFESPDPTDEQSEPDGREDPQIELDDRADGEQEAEQTEDDRQESENLVSSQLDLLFGEIDRAVGIIGQLREEIAGLEQRNGELRQRLEEQDQVINGLQAERERLRSIYDSNASLIENKEEIQRKIETMISRLDSVNTA